MLLKFWNLAKDCLSSLSLLCGFRSNRACFLLIKTSKIIRILRLYSIEILAIEPQMSRKQMKVIQLHDRVIGTAASCRVLVGTVVELVFRRCKNRVQNKMGPWWPINYLFYQLFGAFESTYPSRYRSYASSGCASTSCSSNTSSGCASTSTPSCASWVEDPEESNTDNDNNSSERVEEDEQQPAVEQALQHAGGDEDHNLSSYYRYLHLLINNFPGTLKLGPVVVVDYLFLI